MGSELIKTTETSWTGGWFSWTRQSDTVLRNVEKKILSCLKTAYKCFYVDIGSVVGQSDKVWTISLNEESRKTPLVLLHGLASGVALWCPNLDAFAATRPVYAMDLLATWTSYYGSEWMNKVKHYSTRVYTNGCGFGRSSRPKFASDAAKVEAQWVESVEQWRREVNLDQFVLLGHSLGGYIATAYALKYPERVRHLILADPWGFPEKPSNVYEKYQVPLWARAIVTAVQPLNPLWILRALGPAGRWFFSRARSDITVKYQNYVPDAETTIPDYIYHCNAQTPSGESGFHALMHYFAWAKNPMVNRVSKLSSALPITVLYGSQSWVDNSAAELLGQYREPGTKTESKVINGAGHHIYLDKPDLFNKFVLKACGQADQYDPRPDMPKANNNEDNSDSTEPESTS